MKYIILKIISICLAIIMATILLSSCKIRKNPEEELKVTYINDFTRADYYQNGYTNNYVVGIDQFERTFEATSGEKEDKARDVGIFYFLTLGQHGATKIHDVTQILKEDNGKEILFYTDNKTAPAGDTYFWGEPLYGYYNSNDPWVIRKHLELLYSAGIDFLGFDVTNAFTYDSVTERIFSEAIKLIEEGYDIPRMVFYTNAGSANVINHLYEKYYKNEKYDSCWYRIEGKPLIIKGCALSDLSEEIQNYFYFRDSQWPSESYKENGFPWMEWSYPSPVHNGVINVAVAAHPALPMSFSVTRGDKNWGRGWNVKTEENESEKAYEGQFFQSEWDVAIAADPSIVFVTGWNEWVAGKNLYDGEYAFVDLVNMEFSRDAEIMKGGYNDAFYIQLAQNIRKYKSVTIKNGAQFESAAKTIDINGDSSQWDSVEAVFRTTNNTEKSRNSYGAATEVRYKQAAPRNNISEVRITGDENNFYFYVECTSDIVLRESTEDTSWMNLFIGRGAVSKKGFEGYEFVIGRSEEDGKLVVEKLNSDYTGEKVGAASYSVNGKVMMIEVPKTLLQIDANVNNFYFKMADNIENPSDIMDYYVSGKSFPVGRLSYRYLG